jgi:hypothetical protein
LNERTINSIGFHPQASFQQAVDFDKILGK